MARHYAYRRGRRCSKYSLKNNIFKVVGIVQTPYWVSYERGVTTAGSGKLGDFMKESARLAINYIRSNAKKYKIDEERFDTIKGA